jgi:hypothetical protein
MGRYYNANIKGSGSDGPFDCRTHRAPKYQFCVARVWRNAKPDRYLTGVECDGAPFSLSIGNLILLASRRGSPWGVPVVPAANTGQGFGIVGAEPFPRVPPPCAQKRLGGRAPPCLPCRRVTTFALNARAADHARSL